MARIYGSTNNSNWGLFVDVSETSYNIQNNTSNVTASVYLYRTNSSSYYGGTVTISVNVAGQNKSTTVYPSYPTNIGTGTGNAHKMTTFTYTVIHNSDGSKTASINMSWNANFNPTSGSASGNLPLTKIPRASSVLCSGGNIGSNTTITISRYSNTFTHTITYSFGSLSGTIATKTSSTSISWTIPTSFYAIIPNSNTGTGTINCITYSGNSEIGRSTCKFTARVTNSNPIFSMFSYEDINDNTLLLTGNKETIIKGKSKLKAIISVDNKAQPQNGASISYYQIDNTKVNYSSISDVILEIENYDKNNISLIAVDSRGNSTTVYKSIANFIEYEDIIKGELSLIRSDNGVGKFVTINFNGVFWNGNFGDANNELIVSYKFKKTTETGYTTGTTTIIPTINKNNFNFNDLIAGDTDDKGFELDESYDVLLVVSDKLSTVTYIGIIGAGKPAIAIYKNKASLGDKYNPSLGGTQIWNPLFIDGKKFGILYEKILDDSQSILEIDNLNLKPSNDYEFELRCICNSTIDSDIIITFNDQNGGYHHLVDVSSGSSTSSGNINHSSYYYNNVPSIREWIHAPQMYPYPTTIKGRIFFTEYETNLYKLNYEINCNYAVSGHQIHTTINGVQSRNFSSISKIKFSFSNNNVQFYKGTKLIIREVL